MSHLKFSNFAKKRKVPATIHTYIFIALCLCECVCVCGAASWSRRGRFMCLWVLPGHQVACAVANSPRCETQCVCVCVWQCAKVAKFKDKSLRKAQQKGSNKQRRNWNSQKATCTHSHYRHTHKLTHIQTHSLYSLNFATNVERGKWNT